MSDLTPVEPIAGATVLAKDFYDDDAPEILTKLLAGPADVVLSDMAASATGDPQTDHLRIMGLAEAAHDFARQVLKPGGTFVAKVLRGGEMADVIFNGTDSRKPLGRAEVSLTLTVALLGTEPGSVV